MNRNWLFAGLAAIAAVLVAVAWRTDSPPGGEPRPVVAASSEAAAPAQASKTGGSMSPTGSDIDELRRRLDDEIRARRELEDEVAALRRQVAGLRDLAAASAASQPPPRPAAAAEEPADAWFDEQALITAGMDSALAGELRIFFERLELERLQLRDRAAREGWDREQRRAAFDALQERELSLRERLGESGYEAYLYASGRPNRVAVTSVLASAPAGQAGIRAGDYILRYDNERIYDWSDLRAATAAGDLSEPVEIEVERDGERLQFYLARGPLGVRTDSRSVAP